jgi:hypothetical protein
LPAEDFSIKASVDGGHGVVDPALQTVESGKGASVSITPDPGFHIASILDNDIAMPIANPYRIANVQEAHTVVVTFANEPPQVRIARPVDGATVCGMVVVQAEASDDSGVVKVSFAVDGVELSSPTQPPYACNWNALTAANGWHTLRATAYDGAGASAQASVRANVENITLHLSGQRMVEKAWLVSKQYARLDMTADNTGAAPVATYELLRQVGSGDFTVCQTHAASELANGHLICTDTYLDKATTYRYKVQAYDASHALLGESNIDTL